MIVTRRGTLWVLVALLGLAVTAALTRSVSQLAGQKIGLASEPVSVIHGLAPTQSTRLDPVRERDEAHSTHPDTATSPAADVPAGTVSVPTTTPAPASAARTPVPGAQTRSQATHTSPAAPTSTPVKVPPSGGRHQHEDSSEGGGNSSGHSGRDD